MTAISDRPPHQAPGSGQGGSTKWSKFVSAAVVEPVFDELGNSVSYPSSSDHAADQVHKSGRCDGFGKVIPRDADLKPAICGGPLFDMDGNFVGLNIARNSRVRSYAIPPAIVRKLVEKK